jgi:hypothetical protein
MALPKQVQAQLAELEELEKTLEAQKKPKLVKDEEVKPDEEQLDTEAEVTEEPVAATPEPEEAKSADTSPTDVADEFEQKYKTLRGKYDAEVPRLHQQVRDLNGKLDELSKSLEAKPEPPTKSKEKVSYVTDADRAEFGEELIDVQRRVAQEVSQEYTERMEQQDAVIQKLQEQLAKTGNDVGEMSFTQRLHSVVPDFAEIDNDERWVAWLNEHDPMLRGPRRDQAAAAFQAGDAEAVLHYVNLFKESISEPETAPRQQRQTELEKQVAPNRSANSVRTQSANQNSKIYSPKEVDNAWTKVRTLNTKGKYADAEKLEAELTAAYMEGRVRA